MGLPVISFSVHPELVEGYIDMLFMLRSRPRRDRNGSRIM